MQIVRYTPDHASEWDLFVSEAKNGTFLFERGYMDYHSHRFKDHSLLFYTAKGKLLAVMPANEDGVTYYSHQGLTYGGFILAPNAHALEVGELFTLTLNYLRLQGFKEWYYKQMPTIYHRGPSEDDDYWLWLHKAELVDCSLMTVIPFGDAPGLVSASKRNNANRLLKSGYHIKYDAPIADFWPILERNLQERFQAKPVHSLAEIELLQQRFPHQIQCCTVVSPTGEVVAGTVLYLTHQVVKAQYTSASPEGKRVKALDYLVLDVLKHYGNLKVFSYFDFGTSMLAGTAILNEGLVQQKEGFGGRGIASKIFHVVI